VPETALLISAVRLCYGRGMETVTYQMLLHELRTDYVKNSKQGHQFFSYAWAESLTKPSSKTSCKKVRPLSDNKPNLRQTLTMLIVSGFPPAASFVFACARDGGHLPCGSARSRETVAVRIPKRFTRICESPASGTSSQGLVRNSIPGARFPCAPITNSVVLVQIRMIVCACVEYML
jgi:hypothetical protein